MAGRQPAIETYLRTIIGEPHYRQDLVDAFVASGREALAFLEKEGAVKYSLRPLSPDYYPDEPGAVDVGRALEVVELTGGNWVRIFATSALPTGDAAVWRDDG
jgi:hypothetical protein